MSLVDMTEQERQELLDLAAWKRECKARRDGRLIRIAKKKPKVFFDHVKKIVAQTTLKEYRAYIDEIKDTGRKLKGKDGEVFREHGKSLTMDASGLSLYMSLKTGDYRTIAKKAGLDWDEGIINMYANVIMSKTIQPTEMVSPKDLISNKLWAGELKNGMLTPIPTIEDDKSGKKYGAVVKIDYDGISKDPFVSITGDFNDEGKRAVHDALVTLFKAGNRKITVEDIHRVVTQNPRAKITPKRRLEIGEMLSYMRNQDVLIVTDITDETSRKIWDAGSGGVMQPERLKHKKLCPYLRAKLIEAREVGTFSVEVKKKLEDGTEVNDVKIIPGVIYLTAPPILYQYAEGKGQLATTPMKMLDTNKQKSNRMIRNTRTDSIVNFLHRQISTMQHDKSFSRIIKWETLYSLDGISEIKSNENSLKRKRSLTRNKVEKILNEFKENGLILGYQNNKKKVGRGTQFYSFEIKMT